MRRSDFGSLSVINANRLKAMEAEYSRLKQLIASAMLKKKAFIKIGSPGLSDFSA